MFIKRVVVALILVLLQGTGLACNVPGKVEEWPRIVGRVVDLREGVYWSEVYVQTLKRTRSPADAYALSGPILWGRVEKTNGRTIIHMLDIGGEVTTLTFDFDTFVPSRYGTRRFSFDVRSKDSFCVGFEDAGLINIPDERRYESVYSLEIVKEPSRAHLAERLALAGAYVDEQGKKYIFGENGEAVFPDHDFLYSVAFQAVHGWSTYTENPKARDGIEDRKVQEFAFRWLSGRLLIYRVANPDIFQVEERPMLSLTPIAEKGSE